MENKNLFINQPSFEKEAAVAFMDKDPSRWVKQVISTFLQQYPFLQDQPITLDWKRKEPRKGYAVGVINVLGGQIPVIIEEYKLHPMDIFIYQGIFVPLNEELFKMLMDNPGAFQGLSKSKVKDTTELFSPHLDDSSFSPNTIGRYGLTSGISELRLNKYASVIDQISNLDFRQVEDIIKYVEKDAEVRNLMEQNGTLEILDKLANKYKNSPTSTLENYVRNLEVDRQFVYSDRAGNHYVKQANSTVDRTWEVRVSEDEAREQKILLAESEEITKEAENSTILPFFNEDQYIEVNSEGNWRIVDSFNEKLAREINLPEQVPGIGDFGVFLGENGISRPGTIKSIEKTAKFGDLRVFPVFGEENRQILVESSGDYCFMNKKASNNVSDGLFDHSDNLESRIPKIGDYGIVLTKSGASQPFEVISTMKIANQPSWEFKGFDGLNKVSFYVVNADVEGFEQHEIEKNAYYISSDAKFIPLHEKKSELVGSFEKVAASKGELCVKVEDGMKITDIYLDYNKESANIEKISENKRRIGKNAKFLKLQPYSGIKKHAKPNINPHFVGLDGAGLYYLKGQNFEKYAENGHEIRNLNQNDAAWALIHCGGSEEDLRKLAQLNKNELRPLQGNITPPMPAKEVISRVKSAYDKHSFDIEEFNPKLLKAAASVGDKNTVDAILSLGLINRQNIEEYLEVIPTYEMVMSELAKLLLLSRLGVSALSPNAVKAAMDALTKVLLLLKRVKASIKKVK